MPTSINSIKFPVLALKKGDSHIYAFEVCKDLTKTSIGLLNQGIFQNTIFVDANGNKYSILKIHKKKWATPFLGYSLLSKGRLIYIDFELNHEGIIDLMELKQNLESIIEKNIHYSESNIKDLFQASHNYPDLFRLFL